MRFGTDSLRWLDRACGPPLGGRREHSLCQTELAGDGEVCDIDPYQDDRHGYGDDAPYVPAEDVPDTVRDDRFQGFRAV